MPRPPFSPRRAALLFLLVLAGLCAFAYLHTDLRALAAWAGLDGSAADARAHADTLGVAGAIYVSSLLHRADRRASMRALAGRLGARLTFVDAADARDPAVRNILDHLRVLRAASQPEFAWPLGGRAAAYHNERPDHGGSTDEESGMGRSRWWKETVRRGWDEDDVECCKAVKAGSQSERVFVSVAVL
jgi:hypothetical protein